MEGQQLKAWQVADRLVSDMRSLNFETKRNGDAMAELLLPNLRHLSPYSLVRLKAALQSFNANTKRWKP